MTTRKSTPEEIRRRFDQDVERFSNLETAIRGRRGLSSLPGRESSLR